MLLALDLGNTTIAAALFNGNRAIAFKRFLYSSFPKMAPKWLEDEGGQIKNGIYCSVNPKKERLLRKTLKQILPKMDIVSIKNQQIPLASKYKNKNQLGTDRLVNVYSGGKLYGFPCLVIDIGTAVTLDLGGPRGTFEGGLIFPGPEVSFKAIQQGAAKIGCFSMKISGRKNWIGKSTRECLNQGIQMGYGSMIRSLIDGFQDLASKKWNRKLKVVITGGLTKLIKPFLRRDEIIDDMLTLKGLAYLHHLKESS